MWYVQHRFIAYTRIVLEDETTESKISHLEKKKKKEKKEARSRKGSSVLNGKHHSQDPSLLSFCGIFYFCVLMGNKDLIVFAMFHCKSLLGLTRVKDRHSGQAGAP